MSGLFAYSSFALLGLAAVAAFMGYSRTRRHAAPCPLPTPLLKLTTLGVVALMLVLFSTSVVYGFLEGHTMHGYTLLLHVSAGGAWVLLITLCALLGLKRLIVEGTEVKSRGNCIFWVMIAAAWCAIALALLAMFPLTGMESMKTVMSLHGWAGVVATAAGIMTVGYLLGIKGT